MAPSSRRLAAIWIADIVGFSETAAIDEVAALRQIEVFQAACQSEVAARGGRVVHFVGDAVLAEFSSTEDALRAALALRRSFAEAAAEGGLRKQLRIGLHIGDLVTTADGDLFGDAVNTAARLQEEAEPDQILVSEDVWKQLRQSTAFHFRGIGRPNLRGLAHPMAVYSARHVGEGESWSKPPAPRKSRTPPPIAFATSGFLLLAAAAAIAWPDRDAAVPVPSPQPISIAVLPFTASSITGPADSYLVDGLMEEVRNYLYLVESIRNISRWTAMQYATGDRDISEIGTELNVRTVLEGFVSIDGDHINFSARLIDAATGEHLWTASYDATRATASGLSIDVAEQVARALGVPLTDRLRARMAARHTSSALAYEHYRRGMAILRTGEAARLPEAIRYFGQALALDPDFGSAAEAAWDATINYQGSKRVVTAGPPLAVP